MTTAICPGSFDPFTSGHLDIVTRAAAIFDKVVVLILKHPSKKPTFDMQQRLVFIRRSTAHLKNVTADYYEGLLVDYAKSCDAKVIVKGLRAISDFEYEFQQALVNKKLMPETETFFITTGPEFMYLSSSIVKQLVDLNREITEFVPDEIKDDIVKIMKEKRQNEH